MAGGGRWKSSRPGKMSWGRRSRRETLRWIGRGDGSGEVRCSDTRCGSLRSSTLAQAAACVKRTAAQPAPPAPNAAGINSSTIKSRLVNRDLTSVIVWHEAGAWKCARLGWVRQFYRPRRCDQESKMPPGWTENRCKFSERRTGWWPLPWPALIRRDAGPDRERAGRGNGVGCRWIGGGRGIIYSHPGGYDELAPASRRRANHLAIDVCIVINDRSA
jgi:hypothetical protein